MRQLIVRLLMLLGCAAPLLVACGSTAAGEHATGALDATITVTNGRFMPFIQVIHSGQVLHWVNTDAVAHQVRTTPPPGPIKGDTSGLTLNTSLYLNPSAFSISIQAGHTLDQSLQTPGLYDYYDASFAQWNSDHNRVQALTDMPNFPVAMEGILWVQGPISGMSDHVRNGVITGEDEFVFDFVAVPAGGTVSFQNFDIDQHAIDFATKWSAPIDPATITAGPVTIDGIDGAPPHGQTVTFTFKTPGLYYYYCPIHADLDPVTKRAVAHADASEYPLAMEGFILVSDQ